MTVRPFAAENSLLRLGFLGLGWIGRKRLQSIARLPGVQVSALSDTDADNLLKAAQDSAEHAPHCTPSYTELLDCGLDGVVIATPSALHAAQAIAALERGLPVFCQKPIATTADAAASVIASARANDRLLHVDYCYRHLQGMTTLRERIRCGALGKVVAIDATFHNAYAPGKSWCFDPTLAGGGCLTDLGTHLLDLTQWLLGYPKIEWVNSQLLAQGRIVTGPIALEDFALAEFRVAERIPMRLACSWNCHAGQEAEIALTLHGTRASAAWRNLGGSFYDFDVTLRHGASTELLGRDTQANGDDWGVRAATQWIARLRRDRNFDVETLGLLSNAALIDACYRRNFAAVRADASA